MRIAAREGPVSRTASVRKSCDAPGASNPTAKKGHDARTSIPSRATDGRRGRPRRVRPPQRPQAYQLRVGAPMSPKRIATVKDPNPAPARIASSAGVPGQHNITEDTIAPGATDYPSLWAIVKRSGAPPRT